MKFSIVIPVYNTAKYLSECIDSVLEQTYKNYEVILVDDGSVDDSGFICDSYANNFADKIRVFHKKNEGVVLARHDGLQLAKGDVIVFLDSDDQIHRDTLLVLSQRFYDQGCDMVIFNASFDPNFNVPYICEFGNQDAYFSSDTKKDLYKLMITSSRLNSLCIKAVKRELAISYDTLYKFRGIKSGEDLLYSLPLVTYASSICYVSQPLYYYRQHETSTTHKLNLEHPEYLKLIHKEMDQYITIWDMNQYRGKYNARKVRGWVDFVKVFSIRCNKTQWAVRNQFLSKMAEDKYFREAYQDMDSGILTKSQRLIAYLLYRENYFILSIILSALRLKHRLKTYDK